VTHDAAVLLLPLAVAWPAALVALWLLRPLRGVALRLAPTMAWPALALALLPAADAIQLRVPGLFTSMALGVDGVGRAFLLLTALLWSIVGVHAHGYMQHDDRRARFVGFLLATGTGNIGLTIAQDALSFYLFFAVMTFAGYGLVVHDRSAAALRAGRVYIIMAVLGESLLLVGLFAIAALATDAAFARVPEAYVALHNPELIAAALVVGFGVKAGLLPVHLWLPLAHPVAPTPASALLSGAMIKAGVLGWLRFLPLGDMAFPGLGTTMLTLGIGATIYGALVGVTQTDTKTVLAYSSISQMGFMAAGVGAMMLVPAAAPLLTFAVAVYALHHAVAKAALFLSVGIVPPRWTRRNLPWILLTLLPALSLAGAPLTSGALAKVALKDALGGLPEPWPARIDLLLAIAAVGTTLLMARYITTLPEPKRAARANVVVPWLLLVSSSVLAAVWLPLALAPLGELPLATSPAYIAAALWPVTLGVLIVLGALLLRRRFEIPALRTVPAGDIIAIVERAVVVTRNRLGPLQDISLEQRALPFWNAVGRQSRRAIDRMALHIESAGTGAGLGVVVCVIGLLLFLLLRS
jgi:formate hydrogenlyase subunit 3/multisubunit Na+/H+ antiporter MnhD subunit